MVGITTRFLYHHSKTPTFAATTDLLVGDLGTKSGDYIHGPPPLQHSSTDPLKQIPFNNHE
ncbi:hypothetical protein FRX31_015469 [Thalictrum thalictroides]|uniref:Uncharacterized protein n=1 Tax=Thalictrum thalictroides TaxID=46969 RepID=A0A7J6WBY6_THATH|nr:hypothetical protein FRX31_015469 [Thalictrum thalictroides]